MTALSKTVESLPTDVAEYALSKDEAKEIDRLLLSLLESGAWPEDSSFVDRAADLARQLPGELVSFLSRVRVTESASGILVRGFAVQSESIGPTPPYWHLASAEATRREDLYFVLLAALLGEPFSWATLQEGALLNTMLPTPEDENEQSGAGSRAELEWHIEDAFHEFRGDYLGLMTLRNPGQVPTTFASIRAIKIEETEARVLSQARFLIRPDGVHIRGASEEKSSRLSRASEYVLEKEHRPSPVSVLFGSETEPYLRINPPFMSEVPQDRVARKALDHLTTRLEASLEDIVMHAGDVLFIDNFRAVHGRRAFSARYDGTDRWLRKLVVTRDLRKSRGLRASASSRVI